MNSDDRSTDLFLQADTNLRLARSARRMGSHPMAVRLSQTAVELALKAALIFRGIEYPRSHDVGEVLEENRLLFPVGFRRSIPRMVEVSTTLFREREPSLYGDELRGRGAGELYDEESSREAIKDAGWVVRRVDSLFD